MIFRSIGLCCPRLTMSPFKMFARYQLTAASFSVRNVDVNLTQDGREVEILLLCVLSFDWLTYSQWLLRYLWTVLFCQLIHFGQYGRELMALWAIKKLAPMSQGVLPDQPGESMRNARCVAFACTFSWSHPTNNRFLYVDLSMDQPLYQRFALNIFHLEIKKQRLTCYILLFWSEK